MTKSIETDSVYQHEKYGEVLVTGVATMFKGWEDGKTVGEGDTLVFFYDEYDGYGGMHPIPFSEVADEFAKSSKRMHTHEGVEDD